MSDKQEIIDQILPVAVLKALTEAAGRAIPQILALEGLVPLRTFPYRVGRESRVKNIDGRIERIERTKFNDVPVNNELYLVDEGDQYIISRDHFQIERDRGRYYLYDRGSTRGTWVGGKQLGGNGKDGSLELKDGDIIALGAKKSVYVFQFFHFDDYEVHPKYEENFVVWE